ncbi:MAG: TatD family hydrolase [Bacteroidales bacterium]
MQHVLCCKFNTSVPLLARAGGWTYIDNSDMQLFDTHAHLYLSDFDSDIDETLERAKVKGVDNIILPNIDKNSIAPLMALCGKYPNLLHPAMGLHPSDVKEDFEQQLALIKQELDRGKCVAVGEIGIDLYWDKTFISQQVEALKIQLQWAVDKDLPVILHVRDAFDEIFTVLEEFEKSNIRGVFHCFSGNKYQAKKAVGMGFYLGIGGVLTYKKNNICDAVKGVPLERIVLETDAPFLTPVPNRGKRNESANVFFVAKRMSEERGITIEEVAKQTTKNACELFGL